MGSGNRNTKKEGVLIPVEQPLSSSSQTSSLANTRVMTSIGTKPTLIEVEKMRFLIMDAPRQGNLHLYIKEMRKHGVTDVVRVCEPTYQGAELQTAGICLHDMEYADGHSLLQKKSSMHGFSLSIKPFIHLPLRVPKQATKCVSPHTV